MLVSCNFNLGWSMNVSAILLPNVIPFVVPNPNSSNPHANLTVNLERTAPAGEICPASLAKPSKNYPRIGSFC